MKEWILRRRIIAIIFILAFLMATIFLIYSFPYAAQGSAAEAGNPSAPRLVAHAGGEIYGIRLTNSREALDLSYEKGFRFMELDFEWTSDGFPVILHDWGNGNWFINIKNSTQPLTYKAFLERKPILGLHLMDLSQLEDWLSKHKDAEIISDVKKDNLKLLALIREQYPRLYKQLIPQIYSFEEYSEVKSLGYEQMILTVYKLKATEDEIVEFCRGHKLYAVTMEAEKGHGILPGRIVELGVPTYAHTVDTYNEYVKLRDHGVYGVYTDYFGPDEWVE